MPTGPSPSIRLSESKLKSSTNDYSSDAESSWARQQREKKNKRLVRSGLKVGDTIAVIDNGSNKMNNTRPKVLNSKDLNIGNKEPTTPIERILFSTVPSQIPRAQDESDDEQRKKTNSTIKKVKNKLSKWASPLRSHVKSAGTVASDTDSVDNSTISEKYEINTIKEVIAEHFGFGTGLSNEEIKIILNKKSSEKSAAFKWSLKDRNDYLKERIKTLKGTLNSHLIANNKVNECAINNEKTLYNIMNKMKNKIIKLENEMKHNKRHFKQFETNTALLKDNLQETKNETLVLSNKNKLLNEELVASKESRAEAERQHTQAKVALAVAEGRLEESLRQADGWRSEIAMVEAAKANAVKQAEKEVSTSMERECSDLREEYLALKTEKSFRDEELCRLLDINDDRPDGTSIVEVRREIERIREKAKESESQINLRDVKLARAISDYEAANARSAAKDRDMSELMKGLSDIQKAGQAREEELKGQKKVVEAKVNEIENEVSELRSEISILQHEQASSKEIIENLKRDKDESLVYKEQCNDHLAALQVEKELRARAEAKELEERNERVAYSAQMVAMAKEHACSEAQLRESNDSQDRKWREKSEMQENIHSHLQENNNNLQEKIIANEAELKNLVAALNDKKSMADSKSIEEIGRLTGEINVFKERLKTADQKVTEVGICSAGRIQTLEVQLRESHVERRRMHNTIQELRGNVRVFVRIRPFLPGDGVGNETEPCIIPKNENSLIIPKKNGEYNHFSYDRVFAPSASQETIFQEVSELVQSALDGYNVCLFSYGQTGSGKTHTMQGSGLGQMRGIIPRAIEQVGRYKEQLELEGWKYSMNVSFLEIYNETIRDLLRNERSNELKHEIKVDQQGRRTVTDLTLTPLEPTNLNEIEEVMRLASKHRSVASTDMNNHSSRSHSVFTLHLTAIHPEQRKSIKGVLNLVDLAGSERLNRSGAVGDRAKEAMSINKSLSSLTNVFVSIGKKASHIPFRNSKLTYLLQPSLSGDGKTLMITNVSPTEESVQETICALRFASNVNKCELGKPKRSIEEVNNVNVDDSKKVCSQKRRC